MAAYRAAGEAGGDSWRCKLFKPRKIYTSFVDALTSRCVTLRTNTDRARWQSHDCRCHHAETSKNPTEKQHRDIRLWG